LAAPAPQPASGADLVPLAIDHGRSFLVAITDRAGLLGFLGHRRRAPSRT
jgi:hypothetical protein